MIQIITQQLLIAHMVATGLFGIHLHNAPLNDCYAPPPPRLDPPLSDPRLLRPHPLLRMLALDQVYSVVFVPSHSRVAVLNTTALDLLARLPLGMAQADIATLEAIEDLRCAGLLIASEGQVDSPRETQTLSAWLHVTNACNLRCSYCYIAKSNEAMSVETACRAVDAIVRSARIHGYPEIFIKYAGGEASLALETVAAAHCYAQQQAAANGLRLNAGLLSNGVALTSARLAAIRDLKLRLMISLDGLDASHDAQRPTLGGRGSAYATLRGIERALDAGLTPEIAITVTGQSVAGLPDLVDWLLARDLLFSINFYRDHGCGASAPQLRAQEQQLIEGMREVYERIARQPPRWSVLASLLDRADLSAPHGRACAAGDSYLVIDHHGQIAKCQTQLDVPITTVDEPDPLSVLRAAAGGVQSVPADQKEGCRSCEWRYWCAGGCPVATFRATGRFDIQSPNCGIYKALYPDLLRLEGQRLLYWFRTSGSCPAFGW